MIEVEPAGAAELAGPRIDALRRFTSNLTTHGEKIGLIGPKENERIWSRHILNCALLAPLLRENTLVADIGTGGGFPGLVLAIVRPDVKFHLIEPMERRTLWLAEQVSDLALSNVEIHRNRAEEMRGVLSVDYVTARAVSALKKLIPITTPLLKDGGELLFLKGMSVETEIENAKSVLKKFKLKDIRVEVLGQNVIEETTRVFRATVERG